MSYLNKIGINVLYKVTIMNAKGCFNLSPYDCDELISNQLVGKALSTQSGSDSMKNACVTTISLQTYVAIHMDAMCRNMDDKIKR